METKTPRKKTAKGGSAPASGSETETDWKAIAMALGQRVNFAQQNLKAPGTGTIYNNETGEMRSWREYFAEAMEMIPGVTVDRDAMYALDLPKRQRLKFFADREKAKESESQNSSIE